MHADADPAAFEGQRHAGSRSPCCWRRRAQSPGVKAQLGSLSSLQETAFWDGIDLAQLEQLRLRLRTLVPFLDKKSRKIVYTDFKDEVLGVSEETAIASRRWPASSTRRRSRIT